MKKNGIGIIILAMLLPLFVVNNTFEGLEGMGPEPDWSKIERDPYKLPAVRPFLQGYSPAMLTLLDQTLTWDLDTDFDKMEEYFKEYTKKYFGIKTSLNDFEGAEKILLTRTIKNDLEDLRAEYARNHIEYESIKNKATDKYTLQVKSNLENLAMKIYAQHMMLGTQMGYCFEKENEACWILDLDKKAANYSKIRGTKQEKIDDLKTQFSIPGTFYNNYINLQDKYTTKSYKNIDLFMLDIIITNFADNVNSVSNDSSKTETQKKAYIDSLRKSFYTELSPIIKQNKLKEFDSFLVKEVNLIRTNSLESQLTAKKGYKLLTPKLMKNLDSVVEDSNAVGKWDKITDLINKYEKAIISSTNINNKKLFREALYYLQQKSRVMMDTVIN